MTRTITGQRLGGTMLALAIGFAIAPTLAANAAPGAAPYTFAFRDADLADVAEAILGRALGLTYSIDPGVTGKVSFRIDQRLTPAQLLSAFETTLALDDIALVKSGNTLLIEKRAKAKGASGVRSLEEGRHAVGFQTLSVPLTFAVPSEVAKALEAVGAGGTVSFVNDEQNLIVLGGTGQEVEAALQTIKLFDRPSVESEKIRWFPLEKAPAAGVAEEITQLLKAEHANGASLVPLKRLNGIFAFARTASTLDEIARWVAKLDIASQDQSSTLWIYHPKNASADGLKTALSGVLGIGTSDTTAAVTTSDRKAGDASLRPAAPTPPLPEAGISLASGDGVRLGVDKDTNALLISASPSEWLQLQKLLIELDRRPGQIMIEASILEVTLSDDTRFGVDFSVISKNGRVAASETSNASGVVGQTFPGFSVAYMGNNIKAAVEALGSTSRVEVVSAPKIIALDNKTATLDVGDQVPVVSQSAQSTATATAPLVNTVDYKNTGVILKVTPRITGADSISLDVSQEVSSVSATTTSGIDSPTILQRKLESSLILTDGGVVALGGLISSTRSKGDSGVPVLKDVPFLGNLFKSSTTSIARTELIVLLTAHIIRDQPGADQAMSNLLSDMNELKARGLIPAKH